MPYLIELTSSLNCDSKASTLQVMRFLTAKYREQLPFEDRIMLAFLLRQVINLKSQLAWAESTDLDPDLTLHNFTSNLCESSRWQLKTPPSTCLKCLSQSVEHQGYSGGLSYSIGLIYIVSPISEEINQPNIPSYNLHELL